MLQSPLSEHADLVGIYPRFLINILQTTKVLLIQLHKSETSSVMPLSDAQLLANLILLTVGNYRKREEYSPALVYSPASRWRDQVQM